jgi:hypothetical protein
MKRPSCETIPGETPLPHKGIGAGGSSYFSSGRVGSGFGRSVWLEAMATTDRKTKQVRRRDFDIRKYLTLMGAVATPRYLIYEKRGETSFFPDMTTM